MRIGHRSFAALVVALAGTLVLGPAVVGAPARAEGPARVARSARPTERKGESKAKSKAKPSAAPAAEAAPVTTPAADGEPSLRRSNRMELDARLIQGSTPEAGAVYLFQRAPRNLPALVRLRQSYLAEIVLPVLGPGHLPPPTAEARPQ